MKSDVEKVKETWEREPKFLNLHKENPQEFWKATGIGKFEDFLKAVQGANEKGYHCQVSKKVFGVCCGP